MSNDTELDYTGFKPLIDGAASEYAGRYRRYGSSREDMSQTAWVWMLTHQAKVNTWFADSDEKDATRLLARAVRNAMHDAGEDLKAQVLGYHREDLKHYRKGEVALLLDAVFDEEAWLEKPAPDGGRVTGGDPATGGNWITSLADVSRAFDQLGAEDKELLLAFHRDGEANNVMAAEAGVSQQIMSYRHDRALKRMVKLLGGFAPSPVHDDECGHQPWRPGRRAMSNAHAQAITRSNYEDDEV